MSRGVLYMALSAFAFSVMVLLVKLASRELPTGEIVLARAVLTLALSYAMLRRAHISPWGHERRRLFFRGLCGASALACYFLSVARLPLADATTLQNTTPLFTAPLAWWLLGERVGRATTFAIVCGIIGVSLVVHPFSAGSDLGGTAVALGGAVSSAIAYVTVRQLAKTESALVIVFYFPLVATPLAIPWAAAHFVLPSATDALLLLGIGVSTQIGQVFMTRGLELERAGRATAISYLQVPLAMLWQIVFLGADLAFTTIAGSALIIVGTLAVSFPRRAAVRTAP